MTRIGDWQGAVGQVWADEWRRTDRSFADLSVALDAAILDATPADAGQVLDVGCGAGATTLALATVRPALTVTGIDVSAALLAIAKVRAAEGNATNARFLCGDVTTTLPANAQYQLICSRHGVMFATDPHVLFARLASVAAPGARLVFSCFRAATANPWASALIAEVTGRSPAAPTDYRPGPFGFADERFVASLLAAAGWYNARAQAVDFSYVAGAGPDALADATAFFVRIGPVAAAIRDSDLPRALLERRLAEALTRAYDGETVAFRAAAWLWTANA